ncbi:hypothetical protein AB0N09_33395 [Streptomyces erythrochromogenes]|uniref:hypothetical protein n=1 Tax=Streptomyces erythrochromogenes TaxID=285574 RepID=UPI0034435087
MNSQEEFELAVNTPEVSRILVESPDIVVSMPMDTTHPEIIAPNDITVRSGMVYAYDNVRVHAGGQARVQAYGYAAPALHIHGDATIRFGDPV